MESTIKYITRVILAFSILIVVITLPSALPNILESSCDNSDLIFLLTFSLTTVLSIIGLRYRLFGVISVSVVLALSYYLIKSTGGGDENQKIFLVLVGGGFAAMLSALVLYDLLALAFTVIAKSGKPAIIGVALIISFALLSISLYESNRFTIHYPFVIDKYEGTMQQLKLE